MSGIIDPWLILALSSLMWAPLCAVIFRARMKDGVSMVRASLTGVGVTILIAFTLYLVISTVRWLS